MSAAPFHLKSGRCVCSARPDRQKKPRRVRARRREKSPDHVRRRRVRRRKYFTSCKLREPPRAQAMRSAIGQGEPMQNKVQSWNLCAYSAQMIRAAWRKPFQTRTQRSGSRLRACQKYFFDTRPRLSVLAARGKIFVYKMRSFVISVQIPCGSFPDNYTA